MRTRPNVFFAGQMTGVEGYVESAGSGFVAGVNAAKLFLGEDPVVYPEETMIGAMAAYVSRGGVGDFVPMNANFGILKDLGFRVKGGKIAKYEKLAERSLMEVEKFIAERSDTE
jgi:methylenetetrahydrofolate--tRNA-(uracil-5-)-methyltransferase